MNSDIAQYKGKFRKGSYEALKKLNNKSVEGFISEFIGLCDPSYVFVRTDDPSTARYIREKALETGEEIPLKIKGHTCHFDGPGDQARDKARTKYLVGKGVSLDPHLNTIDRDEGLDEIRGYLKGIMKGRELYVCFFCLGPTGSAFSLPAVQLTDSSYVAHSEDILYRSGYEELVRRGPEFTGFFKLIHSEGALEENVSRDTEKRRVYIDLKEETVLSVNTQYGGNTIGLKKLSMRLAIYKASKEGWLTEHMLVMGVYGQGSRVNYFAGAFPSACGKTSTAMLEGESIVGDDIAYLRKIDGFVKAVNVERGIFGIIRDVNPEDDPLIWKALNAPKEVIFSNVLMQSGIPYWQGDNRKAPDEGRNYQGEWHKGKTDTEGNPLPVSHPNARYTIRLRELANCDEALEKPEGVQIKGIIYGGRDSDTSVPVQQAFGWNHGILTMGSTLESETTSATLGKAGVRKFNLMSNLDFLSIPLGRYIENIMDFGKGLKEIPAIFGVNYFLKGGNGRYLTGMHDKRIWIKWMELRVSGEVSCIETPTGCIPLYEDLKRLFAVILNKDYRRDEYEEQFTLRIPENLAKIERMFKIYTEEVKNAPKTLLKELEDQRSRLLKVRKVHGDYVNTGLLQSAEYKK